MIDTHSIVIAISEDIARLVREVLSSNLMINSKTGHNSIIDSRLYKEIDVRGDNDFIFNLYLNDYVQYIENGRRAGSRWPPVAPIIKWARSRGIPTDNSTIFLIRRSIANEGIRPRPFLDTVFKEMDDIWENGWSDKIFDKIIENLTNFFK